MSDPFDPTIYVGHTAFVQWETHVGDSDSDNDEELPALEIAPPPKWSLPSIYERVGNTKRNLWSLAIVLNPDIHIDEETFQLNRCRRNMFCMEFDPMILQFTYEGGLDWTYLGLLIPHERANQRRERGNFLLCQLHQRMPVVVLLAEIGSWCTRGIHQQTPRHTFMRIKT